MEELIRQIHTFCRLFPIVLGVTVLFSILERFFPAGPRKSPRGWLFNYICMGLPANVASILWGVVAGASTAALGNSLGLGWIDLRFATDGRVPLLILTVLLATFIFDFFYYWFHRFLHENRFLWQLHKLHHMDEQLSAREGHLKLSHAWTPKMSHFRKRHTGYRLSARATAGLREPA
jgi:sterol desaturase/sphingolipid hydroxylase (fatty acid hydroxylase superfamily)